MSKHVLLLETLADSADSLLRSQTTVHMAEAPDKGGEIAKDQTIDAIVTRGKGQVDRSLIEACRGLKVIARCGVGLDNVDVQAATEHGVQVLNAPGSNAATIAEHTLALMLMLQRNMYHAVREVKADNWGFRTRMQSDEISGKRLGILGMGNIGRRVAHLGTAFGMSVSYWDKFAEEPAYTRLSMEEVLTQSDIVSLHIPLLPDTQGIIGRAELALMQPHALLINSARGPLIDQEALIEALQAGKLGGFAADVLDVEPPPLQLPLLELPNVLVTPHSGSLTATTYEHMCLISVENVINVLEGAPIPGKFVFNRDHL